MFGEKKLICSECGGDKFFVLTERHELRVLTEVNEVIYDPVRGGLPQVKGVQGKLLGQVRVEENIVCTQCRATVATWRD